MFGQFSTQKRHVALMVLAGGIFYSATIGCSRQGSSQPEGNRTILKFDTLIVQDSTVDHSNIKITLLNDIAYPAKVADDESTRKFQQTFSRVVLNIDSCENAGIETGMRNASSRKIDTYKSLNDDHATAPDLADETIAVRRYDIRTTVRPIFHSYDILCLRKTTETFKDHKQTMAADRFFSFDMENLTRINISDIFEEKDYPAINQILKKQLLDDTGYDSPEQLIELGYFNIDNLSINNNFSLSDSGIGFHYDPYEIACYAVGKTVIRLPFANIKPYIRQSSVVQKLIK